MTIFRLSENTFFPPVELAEPEGLLAVGGDLSPGRLIAAYSQGIFPWFSKGDPILWWFTSPRLVIFPEEFHIPKRVTRYRRKAGVEIRFDHDFRKVIHSCADLRSSTETGTWILPEMIEAFIKLHDLGYAHSVECWKEGSLVGGLYGVTLDRIFFGESMFSLMSEASQYALIALVDLLAKKRYKLIDCQMTTRHLQRFGAREITGKEFQIHLHTNITNLKPQPEWKS